MKLATEVCIDAPAELVWQAFNNPIHIIQWDSSPDWHTTEVANDLIVGGMLKLRIEHRYDNTGFDFVATYTRIEQLRLIEWKTDDERYVCVRFSKGEKGIIVHQTFDAEPLPSANEQQADWQGVLDNFARYVTTLNNCLK